MIPGQNGNHGSWVKCATSAEGDETDISVVLTVKSNLDPHMIIELEDENKSWSYFVQVVRSLCGDIFMLMIYMLKIIAYA